MGEASGGGEWVAVRRGWGGVFFVVLRRRERSTVFPDATLFRCRVTGRDIRCTAGCEGDARRGLHAAGLAETTVEIGVARLLEIADKCPVHRTLESDPEIVTELVD